MFVGCHRGLPLFLQSFCQAAGGATFGAGEEGTVNALGLNERCWLCLPVGLGLGFGWFLSAFLRLVSGEFTAIHIITWNASAIVSSIFEATLRSHPQGASVFRMFLSSALIRNHQKHKRPEGGFPRLATSGRLFGASWRQLGCTVWPPATLWCQLVSERGYIFDSGGASWCQLGCTVSPPAILWCQLVPAKGYIFDSGPQKGIQRVSIRSFLGTPRPR